jgi:hypothetical protein
LIFAHCAPVYAGAHRAGIIPHQTIENKNMIGLAELKSLNNRPPAIRDNFNRDSSCVESAKGFVIHSAVHRSTAFVDKARHADCFFALQYWKCEQRALNGFVEAIIDDSTLETAEANAFARSRPDWTVRKTTPKQAFGGSGELIAERQSGKLTQRAAACTWRHLHARTA